MRILARRLLPIAVAPAVAFLIGLPNARAAMIISTDLGNNEAVEPTDIAGFVPASGWTQTAGTPGFPSTDLFFSDGTDSGADIATGNVNGSGNSTAQGASTATPDFEMFNRGINIPSNFPQPRNGFINITNIPTTGEFALGYDIYVYITGRTANPGAFQIGIGDTTFFADFADGQTFTGTYEQITSTDINNRSTSGNYVLFSGLTGSSQSIDVTAANNQNIISGLQIVAVIPEPAALSLLGAGLFLISGRRVK